ncbi:probable inactive serine/threonine-protein kinase slob2 [Rhagoletis pomonella]|uniref:probable inactive serine/threonine-protein kinase slob2 n=1 Tax=Rhagoletis pomonella TaxID=28610 RepID=UPI0017825928|nr:probable inactive serine/threonine-protein kinase slob2 [Rhagoletis pomonella]
MLSIGITDSERTPLCLESKMRTLLQAYKSASDNNRSTGASPCFAPFMELMNEIFGRSPIISNDHTVHVGFRPATVLSVSVVASTSSKTPQPSLSLLPPSPSPTPSPLPPPSPSPSPSPLPPPSPSPSPSPLPRRKRSAREAYLKKKNELKKLQAEEKLKLKAKSIQQFKELLKEKFERDADIEKRKLELLEKLANK